MGHRDIEEDREEAARYMMKQEMKQTNIFNQSHYSAMRNPF